MELKGVVINSDKDDMRDTKYSDREVTSPCFAEGRRRGASVKRQTDSREEGEESREETGEEDWRNIEMSKPIPEELRAKKVKTFLTDLLEAARSTHEATAVLHHTSYSITELDSLKLHTNFIHAQAERITSLVNELVGKIEAGEITMEDFSLK